MLGQPWSSRARGLKALVISIRIRAANLTSVLFGPRRASDERIQSLKFNWFGQMLVKPAFHRPLSIRLLTVARNREQSDRPQFGHPPKPLRQLVSVDNRQSDIEQNHVRRKVGNHSQGRR